MKKSGRAADAAALPQPITLTVRLILVIAALGFVFDLYELLMLPLVLFPALDELLPGTAPGSAEFNTWRALMFWVPAMTGGAFGLLGGYLTDRLGRRRILTWSILLYAVSALAAGFATSMRALLILRCTTLIGVSVEFVAAVAWLAELFPNPAQRDRALAYTQAFSSLGGLLVGGAFLAANHWAHVLPPIVIPDFLAWASGSIAGKHAPWRYTLISGLIPAIPLCVVRPFLPESPVWKQKWDAGALRRPSFGELFGPGLRHTTLVTTLMVACSYGAAWGTMHQMPQIVPRLSSVRDAIASAKNVNKAQIETLDEAERARWEKQITTTIQGKTAGQVSLAQEVGAFVGRFLLALLVVRIASRRTLLRVFLVPGVIVVPAVFVYAAGDHAVLSFVTRWDVSVLYPGVFLTGLLTGAQLSYWGNYLPLAYPIHLRGTGESVAANLGGRMIGTSFAAVTSVLSGIMPGADDAACLAYAAAAVGAAVFLINLMASFALPEPMLKELAD